jgi:hypothetical protein
MNTGSINHNVRNVNGAQEEYATTEDVARCAELKEVASLLEVALSFAGGNSRLRIKGALVGVEYLEAEIRNKKYAAPPAKTNDTPDAPAKQEGSPSQGGQLPTWTAEDVILHNELQLKIYVLDEAFGIARGNSRKRVELARDGVRRLQNSIWEKYSSPQAGR